MISINSSHLFYTISLLITLSSTTYIMSELSPFERFVAYPSWEHFWNIFGMTAKVPVDKKAEAAKERQKDAKDAERTRRFAEIWLVQGAQARESRRVRYEDPYDDFFAAAD